ncbi:hypothetical protein SAMN05216359_11085 [Roseateles sp. YR242]|uniref:hypothetical protein n=1 Tax=Roseateles sp. YR242 TaxID=1855305 RepID=UPI0008D8D33A|nr:hypothetical protein [Roseateles sp. YR242]SEL50849.1 hypothetical protein SAMN05216359_11085 [Roseateles sp. YR242]
MDDSINTRFDPQRAAGLPAAILPLVDKADPSRCNDPLQDADLLRGGTLGGRHAWLRRRGDEHFLQLLNAFRATGGLARDREVVRLGGDQGGRCLEQLMRARLEGRLIQFDWSGLVWMPLFQFDADMRPNPDVQSVVGELVPVFDGWELAQWFAQPNGWLDLLRPLDLVFQNTHRVIEAARADRFIAAG